MATKVAYRIEVTGQQASLQKLKPFSAEIANISKEVEALNKSLSGGPLEAFAKRLAQVVADLKAANQAAGGARPRAGSGGSATRSGPSPIQREGETVTEELRRLLREAKDRVGETSLEYEKLVSRVAELKAGQKGVTDEIRRQQKAFQSEAFEPGSYQAIQAEVEDLAASLRKMGKARVESLEGQRLIKRQRELREELKSFDKQLGLNFRNVGNYRDSIRGLQSAFLAISSISVAGVGAREIIEANAAVSDSISDVRKTTGLGQAAIEGYNDVIVELSEDLKGLDTRTSLAELLDISRVGGQLGIVSEFAEEFERLNALGDTAGAAEQLEKAREGLLGFTQVVDEVVVSLGEDLPGGVDQIARDFGRLNSLLNVEEEFGIEGGIRVLASAVNTLGAAGEATEGQIVDFSRRLAGLAGQANLSAGDLVGFAAAFDEIGLSSEVTATAFTQLALSLGKDVETFAGLAGTSVEEFRTLLETDVNEAILTLLDNLNIDAGNAAGVERLQKILEPLGIDGARAAQAIGGLAGNTDLLRKRQEQANKEFQIARGEIEGTLSVTEEFNEKNNNLAANLEKVRNAFLNSLSSPEIREGVSSLTEGVVSILPSITEVVGSLIRGGVAIVRFFIEAVKVIKDFGLALGVLTAATLAYNAQLRAKLVLQAKSIFQIGVLSKVTKAYRAVQLALNAAFAANPIGLVITLVAALVVGIANLQERYERVREAIARAFVQFDKFLASLGPFTVWVRAFIFGIKVIIDAISDWRSAFEGVKAAIGQIVNNISSDFEQLVNRAKIVGKQLQQALSFDSARDAALQQEINALEEANKKLEQSETNIAEAYQKAFNENRARRAELEAERAENNSADSLAKLEAETKTVTGTTEEEVTGGGGGGSDAAEEARKKAEEAAKNRLDAERRLRDLQASLIADEFERSLAELNNSTADEISKLVGDPEQITAQAELLRERLALEYGKVFEERASVLAEESAASIEELGNTNGLLPLPEEIRNAGAAANAELIRQNEALVQNLRQRLAAQGVEEAAAAARVEAFRAELAEKEEAQITENNATLLQLQVESLEQRRELEVLAEEARAAERIADIYRRAEEEQLAQAEVEELLRLAEADQRQKELDSEREYWEQRAALVEEGSLEFLRIQAMINKLIVEGDRDRVKDQIEAEKELEEKRKRAQDFYLDLASDYFSIFEDLLSADEEKRREYAGALKALALSEIAINLYREIQSIRANATVNALPPPAPQIIKGLQIGAAVAQSLVAANNVRRQEFGEGGPIESEDSGKKQRSNSAPVLQPGNIFGQNHFAGGVLAVTPWGEMIEVEGGERYIQNGPEGYVINARSNGRFSGELNRIQQNPNTFIPERREAASAINSFKGWGKSFREGGIAFASTVTAPLRRASLVPEGIINRSAQNAELIKSLEQQNKMLNAGLQSIAGALADQPPTIVQNNNNPEQIVRAGLSELSKRDNGIQS